MCTMDKRRGFFLEALLADGSEIPQFITEEMMKRENCEFRVSAGVPLGE